MKVILYMAMSVNGIIARENNEEDFLSHQSWISMLELCKETGTLIWGRKTQEVVKTWDKKYLEEIQSIRKIIVSTEKNLPLEEGFTVVNSPKEALERLQNEGFETALVVGGSTLNSSFAKEGLIDEVILNIDPVIVGKGIPLFKSENFDLNLSLVT